MECCSLSFLIACELLLKKFDANQQVFLSNQARIMLVEYQDDTLHDERARRKRKLA